LSDPLVLVSAKAALSWLRVLIASLVKTSRSWY
jgi:hypothetical protein